MFEGEFAGKLGTNQAYVPALETRSNFSLEAAIELLAGPVAYRAQNLCS